MKVHKHLGNPKESILHMKPSDIQDRIVSDVEGLVRNAETSERSFTDGYNMGFKNGRDDNTLHAAVTGVRDGIANTSPRGMADPLATDLTAALDAAPATGEGARSAKMLCPFCLKRVAIRIYPNGDWEILKVDADAPPPPAGIDPADVRKVRDKHYRIMDDRVHVVIQKDEARLYDDLTALIAAAGDQVPMVPVSVCDAYEKYLDDRLDNADDSTQEACWEEALDEYHKALAPHRAAPLADERHTKAEPDGFVSDATEPVCETCGDIDPLGLPELPCPDCTPAPPTTEQRVRWWRTLKKRMPGHLEGVGGLAVALSGECDAEVTAWLDAQAQGGGDDERRTP